MGQNIFSQDSNLEVDFSRLKQNLVNRAQSRFLTQFWQSSLLVDLLGCISNEVQELYDAEIGIQEGRTLDKAEGVSLDVLGDIVGATKTLYNYQILPWLAPDRLGREVDATGVWVTNAPTTGNKEAPDNVWRQIILSKIFKNHMVCASAPEIRAFVKMIGDLKISLIVTGTQSVQLVVPSSASLPLIRFLMSVIKDVTVNSVYQLPLPPEVELAENIVLVAIQDSTGTFCSFAADQGLGKVDLGRSTLTVNIGENV